MDPLERLRWLELNALPLGCLTSELTGNSPVTAYLAGTDLWIASDDFGCLRTDKTTQTIDVFPLPGLGEDVFAAQFVAAWIPQIQSFWGRQVLHASTVAQIGSTGIVAFSGEKESGKSTLAYGLAQRPGWRQLGDDMLIFEVLNDTVEIVPFAEAPRLRPTSSAYFETSHPSSAPTTWPEGSLRLDLVYSLEPSTNLQSASRISRLTGANAYTPLLQQAFNLTLALPELKRGLIENYATLANQTRVFRLEYRQQIDQIPRILDAVEEHLAQVLGDAEPA